MTFFSLVLLYSYLASTSTNPLPLDTAQTSTHTRTSHSARLGQLESLESLARYVEDLSNGALKDMQSWCLNISGRFLAQVSANVKQLLLNGAPCKTLKQVVETLKRSSDDATVMTVYSRSYFLISTVTVLHMYCIRTIVLYYELDHLKVMEKGCIFPQ